MDSEYSLIGKELVFDTCDFQMMFEVSGHIVRFEAFQMASGHNSGGYRTGCMIHELIEQVILASEEDGEYGFGVMVELTDGLDLGEYIKP